MDTDKLARLYKIPLDEDGFLMEAHAKLKPVDCAIDGIFICGLAHYPKPVDESIAQAQAAVSRAITILSKGYVLINPYTSVINQELCIGCGLCEMLCPYGAIHLVPIPGAGHKAESISALCKGCGTCAAGCPQKAIDIRHFKDDQILAQILAGGGIYEQRI
jgi:heterodisulfide reductase subunit A